MPSPLEAYLNQVAAHSGAMPVKRRNEELREMRTHLEAAAAAYRELGQPEEDAMQNALVQFGAPDALGQSAVAAWRRGVRRDWRDLAGAAACTCVLMVATHLIMLWCSVVPSSAFMHSNVFRAGLRGGGIGLAIGLCNLYFARRAVLGIEIGLVLFCAAFFDVLHLGLLGLGETAGNGMGILVGAWLMVRLKPWAARKQQTSR